MGLDKKGWFCDGQTDDEVFILSKIYVYLAGISRRCNFSDLFFCSSASWKFLFSWSVNFLLISGLLVFFLSIFAFLLDLRRYWRPLSLCIQIIEFLGNCESFFGFIQSLSRIA